MDRGRDTVGTKDSESADHGRDKERAALIDPESHLIGKYLVS